ncbi:MAG TPA: methyltransferase domain-containing protein [Candidatus Kapabacteria bacterium]|nr:methyltransferase domain-containing protein [Candidatus Kapabacteria bacterium]
MEYKSFAYQNMTFNSPLSEDRAAVLVERCSPVGKILDLGCGWGELLLRALAANPDAKGIGVDTDLSLVDRGEKAAADRGLQNRVEFICKDATAITDRFDLVIALGVTHIWGNDAQAIESVQKLLKPAGKLLYGAGIWIKTPSAELLEIFGELPTFDELQNLIQSNGFEIIYSDVATTEEWDAFESSWRRGLEESGDAELIAFAAERKREYEEGYRGMLGFGYMVLKNLDSYIGD